MSSGALGEVQDYAVAVVSLAIIYIIGGVILENIIGVGLLSNTSSFYSTIASVESMWNSSLGIMSAVVIISAAVIIMRQLRSFNN